MLLMFRCLRRINSGTMPRQAILLRELLSPSPAFFGQFVPSLLECTNPMSYKTSCHRPPAERRSFGRSRWRSEEQIRTKRRPTQMVCKVSPTVQNLTPTPLQVLPECEKGRQAYHGSYNHKSCSTHEEEQGRRENRAVEFRCKIGQKLCAAGPGCSRS